jgi:hypothetical protein
MLPSSGGCLTVRHFEYALNGDLDAALADTAMMAMRASPNRADMSSGQLGAGKGALFFAPPPWQAISDLSFIRQLVRTTCSQSAGLDSNRRQQLLKLTGQVRLGETSCTSSSWTEL